LEIEKINNELREEKKANVIGEIKKVNEENSAVKYRFKIKNIGKSVAENLRIELMENKNGVDVLEKSKLPLDKLYPGQKIDLITSVSYGSSGSTSKIKIKFIWDDKYKKSREEIKEVLIS
jgi:Tfp pilus assembly protein PilO